ncbi:MAG: UvrD-helicase domain-containing protein [Clostridia bacterium]|nr:UvrD-helicase domain-containing protein [Clostridia bacterium]
MDWTREQGLAIDTTGKNILVSAAAGSGKTTVLVERIKNLVINKGADIDRFLITTFTKAAASEMRERLEKAIRKEMDAPGADRARLSAQLQLLPGASIGTFHSFAINIIRQYFYLTDLEPGFGVADDVQGEIMKREALDEVFERRYNEDYDRFREFLLRYSSDKGDDRLKDNILDTYRTLISIPDYIDWAREMAAKLSSDDPMMEIDGYRVLRAQVLDNLEEAEEIYYEFAESLNDPLTPVNYGIALDNAKAISGIFDTVRTALDVDVDSLREALKSSADLLKYKLPSQQWKKEGLGDEDRKPFMDIKKKADDCKNAAKKLLESDIDRLNQDMKDVSDDTFYYIDIIEEFVNVFRARKAEDNLIDFDDAMHYAIAILKNDEAAEELKEKFEYIFIDEYQDSNYLQEVIVGRIARSDNLFMVGDVKQCIYKFRLAEPEMFMEKAELYDSEEETESILINLNSNYRSKRSVTEPVNDIFTRVMEGYDERARLNCTAPDEYPGMPARLHIINREEFEDDAPEKIEAEAAVVAGIIKERLGQTIYDVKTGITRPLTLRDFAVITRKNRVVEEIERYLINEGIDAYGEGSGRYFETVEVQVFMNLLKIIVNMRQDVPLISAMRSVVFGFAVRELVEIRTACREGSFYDAVMNYAVKGENEILRDKIRKMTETVDLWKETSRTVPLEDLMKVILYDTGYYDYCSGLPVGVQRISNLRLIAEKAAGYEQIGHGGLYGFLKYVESMEESNQNEAEAKVIGENEDVVRVMSVHKSKGLEFPVVIFPDASRGTKPKNNMGGSITVHRDFGIGLLKVNREEHWHRKTFLQRAIDYTKEKESIEEEIRILYVALTRAKDCLEIIGSVKTDDKLSAKASSKSFMDMMYGPLTARQEVETITYRDSGELEQRQSSKRHTVDNLYTRIEEAGRKPKTETDIMIGNRLSFEYPYGKEGEIRPKYSVSELNRGKEEREIPVAAFEPDEEKHILSAAEIGTVMHLLMEKADFEHAEKEGEAYLQTLADRLLASETIGAAEYDAINIDNAAAFFKTGTGKRAAAAFAEGKLEKEKEFIFEKEIEGVKTVVQGIIDCFFEEDDQLVLIDYKNSYMGAGRTVEDVADSYSGQIELYRQALEGATGKTVKEAYLYLFDTGRFIKM